MSTEDCDQTLPKPGEPLTEEEKTLLRKMGAIVNESSESLGDEKSKAVKQLPKKIRAVNSLKPSNKKPDGLQYIHHLDFGGYFEKGIYGSIIWLDRGSAGGHSLGTTTR